MKHYVLTFLIALLGVIVALVGWHVWTDHRLVDEIRMNLIRQQAAPVPSPVK